MRGLGVRQRRGVKSGQSRPRTLCDAVLGVEVLRALSNPEVGVEFDRLTEALNRLGRRLERHRVVAEDPRQPYGEVMRTIKTVLAEHPEGLRTVEVRRLVEARLGRELPRSTVKDALAASPAFERLSRGRYRLAA